MATPGGGKKGKKKKGQTISLNAFLGDSPSTPAPAPRPKTDWADDSDDLGAIELAEEYGGPPKPSIDMSKLPSAPRASRGLDVDFNKLPSKPPYTAFLGNLPFDTTEEEIEQLFRGLRVENIRFPQDQGRMKGFGYAEFFDLEQLKQALALSGEKIRNRQVRIDIAEQAGKDGRDGGAGFSRGGFSQADGDGDWRRGGDEGPPPQRYDDRRGGPGGFDRRGPRDDMDGRPPRPMGQADEDDCWRKDNPSTGPPSTNGWGNRRDDDGWGRRPGGGFDDRGPPRGGFDDRGPPRGGFDDRGPPRRGFDDRGPPRGGFDDRGPRDDGGSWRNDGGPPRDAFRDDRGPPRDGFRDDRGPPRDGYRDDRGPPRDGYRNDRGPPRDGYRDDRGFRDDRGPPRDGYRDDRGPPRDGYRNDRGFRDDRGPPRDGGFRDNRGPPRDGYRDDRGPRDGGFRRDDRGYNRGYDDRGPPRDDRWRNDRDPPQDRRGAPDIVPEGPKERPKLNLQPRTAEATETAKTPTSSIFGGARPVDTAAKERQIEDKMAKSPNRENRDRSRENRDRRDDGEKDYRSPPRESDKREEAPDNTAENWRDESLRQDNKSRSTRPDIIPDSEKGGGRSGGSRGRGRGRGRGNDRGKKNADGGPIVPPKYEEPPKVSFGQSSKFALLADDDEEGGEHSDSNDEASTEEIQTS